ACHAIRQGGLADTGRTADQPGMCDAATLVGLEKCLLRFGVAEQRCRLARQFCAGVFIVRGHGVDVSAIPNVSGCRRSLTIDQILSAATSSGARPSMTMQRFGSAAASAR